MKLPYLITTITVCVLLAACSKDKFTTKPQLELKSVNGTSFVTNSNISFNFVVTDKEGDIQDSMWIQKISLVCNDPNNPSDSISRVPTPYLLPVISKSRNLKVDLDVNYTYGSNNPGGYVPISRCAEQRDDSIYFRFWLRDKAGNVSDTVTSETITLLKD